MAIQRVHSMLCGLLLLTGTGTLQMTQAQDAAPISLKTSSRFERLDGLSHNTILSITQDQEGFLWIGTSDGLNRYDGYDFTAYRHVPGDSTSLSNNTIKAVLGDQAGHLWVGTDDGLHRLNRRTGQFVRYALRPDTTSSRQAIFQLLEDHAGRLWVGSSDGLYRYERQANRFVVYRHEPTNLHSLTDNNIWSLYEDRDHILWVGSIHGLHRYDPKTDHFTRFPVPSTEHHIAIHHKDASGHLWLSGQSGMTVFDPASRRFTVSPAVLAGQHIEAVLTTRDSMHWIGTDNGLYRYNATPNTYHHLPIDPVPGAYLQNRVKTLYKDRAGALWIGTFSGLYRLDPHVKPFGHLSHHPTDPNSLSGNTVMAILADANGAVWVGTLGAGLNRMDRTTGMVTHYRHAPGQAHTLCNDLIWSLYEDRRGWLWVGTDEGLCGFDPQTRRFTRYDLPLGATQTRQPPVNAIREDAAGHLWMASNIGLYRLDPQTGALRWYDQPGDEHMTSSTFFVQSLHTDRAGGLWMGTFGGGLYRFDPATEHFTRYPLLHNEQEEIVSEGIWAIHEDAEGALWLGSDLGLTRLDPQTGATHHITQADGLPGSIVYALLEDVEGRFWLSTNHGLVRFAPHRAATHSFRIYDPGDGLKNTEFNRRAAFKGSDGTFYFGGLNGLTWFHPATIQENPYVPPVAITRIETSNRDTTVTINPHSLKELVLSYRDYTVSFAFTALNFTNPTQNQYAYQLEGFDEQWIEVGSRRFASYTNIPPGTYTFRVRGSNDDGVWNEQGARLALTITPPFWQTWWFRLLLLAALVGLLAAGHRYRVARLIEMERLRMRIAQDLHDDIGSGLSSIALASELAGRDPGLGDDKRRHFAIVTNKARQLANALTDIVWLVDPKQDQLDDLIEHMEESTRTMLVGLDYTFERPTAMPPHPIDPDIRRHVYLLYKEILHNIVKHARATKVNITLEKTGRDLMLIVADNGVGFEETAMQNGHGLQNMKHRAAQMHGSLVYDGKPGTGTTVHFTARLP
ncbi:MAG TPA: two-component regulator propeller domain-containing protein [Rhodothermales bacterium]|nr:two-component regulator propeller domain-containing protein [Rhodothermales bacterium]